MLDMVRSILSSMNSNDVDRYDLTTESLRVAEILRDTYYELISARDWKHLRGIVPLLHSGSPNKPNYLKVPPNVTELLSVEYAEKPLEKGVISYKEVKFVPIDQFLRLTSYKNELSANLEDVEDYSGVRFAIVNNKSPDYWTTFDDQYLVFDSYNKDQDDALQPHKVRATGYSYPVWEMRDDFVPDLPTEAFPALLEEARSTAFFNIKQMVNEKAEQKAIRHRRRMSQKGWVLDGYVKTPNYGRRSAK